MRIDKDSLLQEANCIDVAKYIGIDVVKRGANYFILCPGHMSRLGKKDTKIGNCVLYPDGYICYACDPNKKHNCIDMTMEHLNCSFVDALQTIADIYGGASFYQSKDKAQEKLPLTPEDLKLIGLKASGKLFMPINGSFSHFEPSDGTYLEKNDNCYLAVQAPSSYSLLNLKKDNEDAFCYLIASKAKEAGLKYQNALKAFGKRTSEKASSVFDIFEENGYVDDSVFFGIQNALKKKIWRCKEIYDAFNKKNNA